MGDIMNGYMFDLNRVISTEKLTNPRRYPTVERKDDTSFDTILKQKMGEIENINFSKHAKERIQERNIDFDKVDMTKIDKAFELAEKKDINDSLILLNDTILIVNVPSRTVITVVDGKNIKQNVFTNIDGAVIV